MHFPRSSFFLLSRRCYFVGFPCVKASRLSTRCWFISVGNPKSNRTGVPSLFGRMANSNPGTKKESQSGTESSPSATIPPLSNWEEAQESLKKKLITEDDFASSEELKYVGGVDISFSKGDPLVACGTLVVLELHSLKVVYEDFSLVTLHVPYVPGFLAFREAPVLLELLEKMKSKAHPFYPQVLMVDGNGVLHPRGFGLACHLGVLANLPTIGVGKNLHHVDGLTLSRVKELFKVREHLAEDFITLTGDSGRIWGGAMRSTGGSLKPIFISIGHRISLNTAITIVKMTCKYRVPEPTRQADIRSREYVRKHRV